MTQIIRIDKKTVRHNPNAGRTSYMVPSAVTTMVTCSCTPTMAYVLEDSKVLHIIGSETTIVQETKTRIKASLDDDTIRTTITAYSTINDVERLRKLLISFGVRDILIDQKCDYQRIVSMTPEPNYFYEFKKTKIQCTGCKKKFYPEELRADAVPSGYDEEDYSNEICPCCGKWDCVDFEYEQLDFNTLDKLANKNGGLKGLK